MADGESRNVLLDSVSIYEALNYEQWIDAEGFEHDIDTMDPIHRFNCIGFLQDRAPLLQVYYDIGSYYWIAMFDPQFDYNDAAMDIDEQEFNIELEPPLEWIETVPIMQKLRAAHEKFEGDHNFAVSEL